LIFRLGGAPPAGGKPEIWTSAESMPSAEVPDIMPSTSMDLLVMKRVHVIFNTQSAEDTEKREGLACKE